MKLYQRVGNLSQWLRFQATYLEMKYYYYVLNMTKIFL